MSKKSYGILHVRTAWSSKILTIMLIQFLCPQGKLIGEESWWVWFFTIDTYPQPVLLSSCFETTTCIDTNTRSRTTQGTVYSLFRGDGATEEDLATAGHSGRWVKLKTKTALLHIFQKVIILVRYLIQNIVFLNWNTAPLMSSTHCFISDYIVNPLGRMPRLKNIWKLLLLVIMPGAEGQPITWHLARRFNAKSDTGCR